MKLVALVAIKKSVAWTQASPSRRPCLRRDRVFLASPGGASVPPVPSLEKRRSRIAQIQRDGRRQGSRPSKAQGRTGALGARAFRCAHRARGRGAPFPGYPPPLPCILEGRRWHQGSILRSPGAGLPRPFPPGSLPVWLRPGSLPGSRPSLRPNCQASLSGSALQARRTEA